MCTPQRMLTVLISSLSLGQFFSALSKMSRRSSVLEPCGMTSGAIRRFCLLGDYALKANRYGGSQRGRSEAWKRGSSSVRGRCA